MTSNFDQTSDSQGTPGKGKVLPYSLPSVRPGADPGVQAVWLQVTVIHPAVGCHYLLPGLWLTSQPKSVIVHWPVPNYTAWLQMHIHVSSLPKAVTFKRTGQGSNPQLFLIVSECSTVTPHRPPGTPGLYDINNIAVLLTST